MKIIASVLITVRLALLSTLAIALLGWTDPAPHAFFIGFMTASFAWPLNEWLHARLPPPNQQESD